MGVLEGCDRFLKYIFFFFTFVLFLLGLLSIGIGAWASLDKSFDQIVGDHIPGLDTHALKQAAVLLIIVGVGIMLVGFLGCCGAMKENQCFLALFSICLFLIFCLMIAGAVLAGSYQSVLRGIIDKGLGELEKTYNASNPADPLNKIQEDFKCCESNSSAPAPASCYPAGEPTTAPVTKAPATKAPATKAPATKAPATKAPATEAPATATAAVSTEAPTNATVSRRRKRAIGDDRYTEKCADAIMAKLNKALDEYKFRISGIGVASAIIVVLGMIVSMALCCKIRRGSYTGV